MRKWFVNNPFFVLLVPLVAFILICTYLHWPITLDKTVSLGTDEQDTIPKLFSARITSIPQERPKTWRYDARVLRGLTTDGTITLYIQKDTTACMPQAGDTILVCSATNYVDRFSWRMLGKNTDPWWRSATGWRSRLMQRYKELGIEGCELGTIGALTLGYREDLDPDIRHQFSAAGAMHVLAVSGLHTGILMSVLISLFTLFGWRKPFYEERGKRIALGVVVMACLVGYAYLTGCSPSVVRSVIMSCFVLLAMMTNRQNQMLNAVFAAAFFILLFRPMDLYSVSFQLSFAAVLSIALFGPGWANVVVSNYFTGIIGMTIAAMIGTMPVTLYYFGQISNYFMLTNLIVLPLAWLMMVGGLLTLTIGWIAPIGKALAWLTNLFTWLMDESVGWIERLPGSTTQVVLSGPWLVALIIINLGILMAWNRVTTK